MKIPITIADIMPCLGPESIRSQKLLSSGWVVKGALLETAEDGVTGELVTLTCWEGCVFTGEFGDGVEEVVLVVIDSAALGDMVGVGCVEDVDKSQDIVEVGGYNTSSSEPFVDHPLPLRRGIAIKIILVLAVDVARALGRKYQRRAATRCQEKRPSGEGRRELKRRKDTKNKIISV